MNKYSIVKIDNEACEVISFRKYTGKYYLMKDLVYQINKINQNKSLKELCAEFIIKENIDYNDPSKVVKDCISYINSIKKDDIIDLVG